MGNVKLIIEIPEWYYEETKEFKHPTLIDKAILNGTPLDDVKADIKTYTIIKQNPIANRKVKADSIEVWKAKIIEKEHIKELFGKIRAEIAKLSNANPSYWHSGDMVERDDVLDIIDKYEAESEDKE